MTTHPYAPIEHEIVVPVDADTAFRLYVTRPGRTHPGDGLSGEPADIVYEPFVGGRWYERDRSGREHDWGRILVWDPPRRLTLAWMVNANTGSWAYDPDPAHASRADITFEPVESGTRVRVRHTELDNHGPAARRIRKGADNGWQEDLADLARAASRIHPQKENFVFENGFVNLYTGDMSRSLTFYKDVLGLAETFRVPQEEPDHVELTLEGMSVALSTVAAAKTHHGIDASPGAPAMCLVIWTTDLDRAYAHLVGSGAPVVLEPHEAGNGNRSALLRDPDGNLVELVAKVAVGQA